MTPREQIEKQAEEDVLAWCLLVDIESYKPIE